MLDIERKIDYDLGSQGHLYHNEFNLIKNSLKEFLTAVDPNYTPVDNDELLNALLVLSTKNVYTVDTQDDNGVIQATKINTNPLTYNSEDAFYFTIISNSILDNPVKLNVPGIGEKIIGNSQDLIKLGGLLENYAYHAIYIKSEDMVYINPINTKNYLSYDNSNENPIRNIFLVDSNYDIPDTGNDLYFIKNSDTDIVTVEPDEVGFDAKFIIKQEYINGYFKVLDQDGNELPYKLLPNNTIIHYSNDDITKLKMDSTNDYDLSAIYFIKASNTLTDLSFLIMAGYSIIDKIVFEKDFDTSNVTDFSNMITGYYNSAQLLVGLENLKLDSATNINNMISRAGLPSYVDLNGWDISNVTDIKNIFSNCYNVNDETIIDIRSWVINQNVTTLDNVFNFGATYGYNPNINIKLLNNFDNWDTSNVTSMRYFCCNATFINDYNDTTSTFPFSNWNMSNVTDLYKFLTGARITGVIDLNNWDVSNVTNFYYFMAYTGITKLLNYNWVFNSNDPYMRGFLYNCQNLTCVEHIDTSNVTTDYYKYDILSNCPNLQCPTSSEVDNIKDNDGYNYIKYCSDCSST